MKIIKYISLSIITVISISCKGQNNVIDLLGRGDSGPMNIKDGSIYLKDISNIYMPFVGSWKWSSGNQEMILVLTKQIKYHYNSYPQNYYEDRLVGYYIYKENGVVIADTSNENLLTDNGISVSFYSHKGTLKVSTAMFIDVKKEKMISVDLEMLSPTQMKFNGEIEQHSSYVNGNKQKTLYSGSTFPLEMVFTKR
ncbi:hypothetical protein OF897_15375 [Chryseobacterium formosus]|uniref:DUF6705 domain-containing protein n=1 Tax=Chryseobacterium formosus TaxID=1537363 RepID=A0ABT3XUE7_9FLAO|nr:DUF6705 family protein [Chryseobacterium formosus]MCX8525298.1 hypothetical protein [Chryseobacterium formosus]